MQLTAKPHKRRFKTVLEFIENNTYSKDMEKKLIDRITVDPLVMSGHPCIRGMRVTVSNVLRQLAAHYDYKRILDAYPYLESADIDACLEYAAILANDREIEVAA